MAAVLSPQKNPSSSSPTSHPRSSPPSAANAPSLPPLVTSPPGRSQRVPSYASKRLSTFSNHSTSQPRSRPQSTAFPVFHSSLAYTLVRDFAYPAFHPLFYGPEPDAQSAVSTPASEAHRRLSDPVPSWDGSRSHWSAGPWGPGEQLPQTSYGDGPPWSEDEDLHSPIVTSSKHKKHKSNAINFDEARGRQREFVDPSRATRTSYAGTNGDGSQTYYVSELDADADGPGGEYVTYPRGSESINGALLAGMPAPGTEGPRRDSHFATTLPNRAYDDRDGAYLSDEDMSPAELPHAGVVGRESRYSRDYQFTIASPDEEMHGKAVALFDFTRENENELPLAEGQVILVSYRHGQGWLVAQDPKTGESGLVPEEYVRLLRDIEGGWSGLMNGQLGGGISVEGVGVGVITDAAAGSHNRDIASPFSPGTAEQKTPTQTDHRRDISGNGSNAGGAEYYTPVVSTFSTSTRDFDPYPPHLLSPQGTNPQVASGMMDIAATEKESRSNDSNGLQTQKGSGAGHGSARRP